MNALTFPRSAFIGFDRLFDELTSTHWTNIESYPPHNIVKTGEDKFAIELAIFLASNSVLQFFTFTVINFDAPSPSETILFAKFSKTLFNESSKFFNFSSLKLLILGCFV